MLAIKILSFSMIVICVAENLCVMNLDTETCEVSMDLPSRLCGLPGRVGKSGQRGPQGLKGSEGLMGPQGLMGPRGIKGEKGYGPQGSKGVKGDVPEEILQQYEARISQLQAAVAWVTAPNGYEYKMSDDKATYAEAERACTQMNAQLAAVGPRDRNILNFFKQRFVSRTDKFIWIGLTDRKTEGVWVWSDGVRSTPQNTFWQLHQPNSWKGRNQDCAAMHKVYTYLGDEICTSPQRFLCEK